MPEWPLRDGGRTEDPQGLCPECGGEVECTADAGSVTRCPRCRSWLYQSLFSGAGIETPDGAPCRTCCSARPGDSCVRCDAESERQRRRRARKNPPVEEARVLPLAAIEGDGPGLRNAVELRAFERLRTSIAAIGLVEPIVVRPTCLGTFEIVDGFRRWLAARQLGAPAIAARVVELTPEQRARWRLAANLHREDLAPLDEAEAFYGAVGDAGEHKRSIATALGLDTRRIENLVAECTGDLDRIEGEIYGTHADREAAAGGWTHEIDLSVEPRPTGEPTAAAEPTPEPMPEPMPEPVPVGGLSAEDLAEMGRRSGETVWARKAAAKEKASSPETIEDAGEIPPAAAPSQTGLRLVSGSMFERKLIDELKNLVDE